ncbi:MAG: response regulator transcription factor [Opitutaceae bacterium]
MQSETQPPSTVLPPTRILVVDDNAAALKGCVRLLRQAGYEVAQAEDGRAALALVRTFRPALVLLDVVLPDISGREVLRQIKADPQWAGISVVLFSSIAISPEAMSAGLKVGADGYIARPIPNHELLARVRAVLR